MAIGDPYATLAELKARLSIGDTVDDATLTGALATASSWVENHTGRQFNKATEASARVYSPRTARAIDVDDVADTAGMVVAVDESGMGAYATVVEPGGYRVLPLNGVQSGVPGWPGQELVRIGGRWPCGEASVEVTAVWGWPAVPAPVREATLLAAAEYARLKDAPFGTAGFTEFGVMKARDNPFAVRLLAAYRHDPVLVA